MSYLIAIFNNWFERKIRARVPVQAAPKRGRKGRAL